MKKTQLFSALFVVFLIAFAAIMCPTTLKAQKSKPSHVFTSSQKISPISDTSHIVVEMLKQAIGEISSYFKKYPIRHNKLLFGGIGVLPNLAVTNPMRKSLSNFMSETNLFSLFYQGGLKSIFIDISDIEDVDKAYEADLSSVASYNRFFLHAFARNFPGDLIQEGSYLTMSDNFRRYQEVDQVLYGYFYYSKESQHISPGSLYLVLKVSKIQAHPRNGVIYPGIQYISIVKRNISRKIDRSTEKPVSKEKPPFTFKDLLMAKSEPTPVAKGDDYIRIDFDDFLMMNSSRTREIFGGDSRTWGIIPRTALLDKWDTTLLLDMAQKQLREIDVPLVDTTLIRDHIYEERNRKIVLQQDNIRNVLPNILTLSILSNIGIADEYYFKTAYLAKCPLDPETRNFHIENVVQKDVGWKGNSELLDFVAKRIVEQLDSHRIFELRFDEEKISNVFIENYRGWPRSHMEKEIIESLRYKILELLLSRFSGMYVPVFQSDIRRDLRIDIELDPNMTPWEENVFTTSSEKTKRLGLRTDLTLRYRAILMEEIEMIPWQRTTEELEISKGEIVKDFIKTKSLKELRAARSVEQRLYRAQLYSAACSTAKELEERFGLIKDKYGMAFSESELAKWSRTIESDVERICHDNVVKFVNLVKMGDIETIFLEESGWYKNATTCYNKAKLLAERMDVRFLDAIQNKIEEAETLKKWEAFRKFYQLGEHARKNRDWRGAREKFSKAEEISKAIKNNLRVKSSKRFIRESITVLSIEIMLDIEEILDRAAQMESRQEYRKAFEEYEDAQGFYDKHKGVLPEKFQVRITEGKKRAGKVSKPFKPITAEPETPGPETLKPETLKPETLKPETLKPETPKPVRGRVALRTQSSRLSEAEVQHMLSRLNLFDRENNKDGDFRNDFVDNGNETVTDRATGLMWVKDGSYTNMEYSETKSYIDTLNRERFAGHSDWRLPTVEELASLLERGWRGVSQTPESQTTPHRAEELVFYIDPIFDLNVDNCWSADTVSSWSAWSAYFFRGHITSSFRSYLLFVKAVRSLD